MSYCDRVNLALDFLVLQVHQECLEVKEYPDSREMLVSLVALEHQGDLDLMVVQDLKVFYFSVTVSYCVCVTHTHLHLLFTQNTPYPSDSTLS